MSRATPEQRAAAEQAFLGIMRRRRPDLRWEVVRPDEPAAAVPHDALAAADEAPDDA